MSTKFFKISSSFSLTQKYLEFLTTLGQKSGIPVSSPLKVLLISYLAKSSALTSGLALPLTTLEIFVIFNLHRR